MSQEKLLEAGRDLDRAVAEKMGYTVEIVGSIYVILDEENNRRPLRPYSISISSAWKVFRFVMESYVYSKRQQFFRLLQEQNRTSAGSLISWPDLLGHLRDEFPLAICRAFLALE